MCKHCDANTGRIGFCVLCREEICTDCASDTNNTVHRKCSKTTIQVAGASKLDGIAKPHNRKGLRGVPKAKDRMGMHPPR